MAQRQKPFLTFGHGEGTLSFPSPLSLSVQLVGKGEKQREKESFYKHANCELPEQEIEIGATFAFPIWFTETWLNELFP